MRGSWLDEQAAETLFLTSVTLAELLFGIAAIAGTNAFAIATRDVGPFRSVGLTVINPWATES